MFCSKCGEKHSGEEKFCSKCGNPLNQPQTKENQQREVKEEPTKQASQQSIEGEREDAKQSSLKKLTLKVVFPVVAIIIVLFLIIQSITSGGSKGLMLTSDSIKAFSYDNTTYLISGNNNPKFNIEAEYLSLKRSLDSSKAAGLDRYSYGSSGTLWYITTKEKVKVSEDVYDFYFSDSGNGIAFLKDYDSSNDTATLYLYDTNSKKSSKVADDVYITLIAISPDGKSVGYVCDYDYRSGEYTGYIKIGNKAVEKLGVNTAALAIAKDGKYIYYIKENPNSSYPSFYVRSGKTDNKLTSELGLYQKLFFLNQDYSQIIVNDNGRAFISKNGKEREKIANFQIEYIVMPPYGQILVPNHIRHEVYGIKDFVDVVAFGDDGSLVYINKKLENTRLVNNCYKPMLSNDGKTVFFDDYDKKLYKKDIKNEKSERVTLANDVYNFLISPDGSQVYYTNFDNELFYIKGSASPIKLADDVNHNSLCITADGSTIFYLIDYRSNNGTLYYSKNGGKRTKIADDVYWVSTHASGAFYYTDYDSRNFTYTVYRSNGSAKFELFQADVYIN